MPTQQEIGDALRRINRLVDDTGDEIEQDIEGETGEGASIEGYEVLHGGHTYQVVTSPVWEHFLVRYEYDFLEKVAALRALEGAEPPIEIQIADGDKIEVAAELREDLDEAQFREVRQGLIDRLSAPSLGAGLETHDAFVYGFTVRARLYPYEEEISRAEFYDAVQSVVSLGWKGQEYLEHSYSLHDRVDRDALPNGDSGPSRIGEGGGPDLRGFE